MIVIPAVDLRDGACVQLVGGSFDEERVRLGQPVGVARLWGAVGFSRLHVIDLDAALGYGRNDAVVGAILEDSSMRVQVGGGVRTTERARAILAAGASAVIVGTRAIEDSAWLADLAREMPGRIIVAADVRGRKVVTHGWSRTGDLDVLDFARGLADLDLAGLMVTAVHLEGMMLGTDLPLMADVVASSRFPVIASGGVTTLADLEKLTALGVSAAVVGMALYTGALDARAVAREFGS
jgi:phosphoribosylformimino-5-aminoimidazole carboxamide ribotide isomerase